MKLLKIKKKDGEVICDRCVLAESFFERAKGLMFSHNIPEKGDGMLIKPCNSIHTFFMNYGLHIVFLNSENKVVKVIKNLSPWRMTRIYFSSAQVLEIKDDRQINITEGETLEVLCIS